MPTNPPSVPSLDVEACAGLLAELANNPDFYHLHPRAVASLDNLRHFLLEALPGMGKDGERLDVLESILRNLDAKTEVFLAGLGTTGTARAFQCEVAPATSEGSMAWRSYQGSALRAAIDAAVASTPTEGDPNHE